MKFFVDLARDLAVVALALAVICATGWVVLRRRAPESGNESKTAPPD
jgi:hypothetical protein